MFPIRYHLVYDNSRIILCLIWYSRLLGPCGISNNILICNTAILKLFSSFCRLLIKINWLKGYPLKYKIFSYTGVDGIDQ